MVDSLAGVVLAAGLGRRLLPLTRVLPKPLCLVDGVPLVDLALRRIPPVVSEVAVNVHAHREVLDAHLGPRIHRSFEEQPLGTAGALGLLRGWLDGRGALVVNADAWCPGRLDAFVEGWDGERIRILVVGESTFGPSSKVAGALLPWNELARLEPVPSGLWEVSWRPALEEGRVDVARHDGAFVDCGTPADYLAANLTASGGRSVVGEGAVVHGTVERTVVWAGAVVESGERLVDAIRYGRGATVLVRRPG